MNTLILSTLACVLCCLAQVQALSIAQRIICSHENQIYQPGSQYWTDDCTICFCEEDGPACAMMGCAPPPCLDYVKEKGKCCPVCPNGHNCIAYDKTIIPKGETVTLSSGAVCTCPEYGSDAMCYITMDPPTTELPAPPPITTPQ